MRRKVLLGVAGVGVSLAVAYVGLSFVAASFPRVTFDEQMERNRRAGGGNVRLSERELRDLAAVGQGRARPPLRCQRRRTGSSEPLGRTALTFAATTNAGRPTASGNGSTAVHCAVRSATGMVSRSTTR